MAKSINVRSIRLRRGYLATLPQLLEGELGYVIDNNDMVVGTSSGNKFYVERGQVTDALNAVNSVVTQVNNYSQAETIRQTNEGIRQTNEDSRKSNEIYREQTMQQFTQWYNSSSLTGRLPFFIDGGDFGDPVTGNTYDGGTF